jgi:FkbM family methyltransferase
MLVRAGFFRNKLRSLAFAVFNWLENNNNARFATNGEKRFLDVLFRRLNNNDSGRKVLFDIGANIGTYSRMLLDRSHRSGEVDIHVFEPTHECFEILQNKFSRTNGIILNRKAVSDSNGTADIFFDVEKSSLASLYKRNLDVYSTRLNLSELVETIRLDKYIEERHIEHIDFLKIDIEGHELAAFRGLGIYLNSGFIDFIQFEYGGANLDSHTSLMELYAHLEKAGFTLTKIMPSGLEMRPYSPRMDNFQYANYVAVSNRIINSL